MPNTRMTTIFLRGLLWLYLLGFGYVVVCVEPGFLDFDNLPDTNFSCVGKVIGGYYADLETNCQMFHVCTIGQLDEPMDIRFLCLNGTVFDQETRVCERIDEVDCSKSEKFYSLNLELYGNTQPSVSEDNAETDPPIIIKASTTTTTSTTTQRPKPKTTKIVYTTAAPTITTVTKVISAHHFPISSSPDIRFNPEEINISLNPGTPPNIRSKSVAYQQQVFNNDNKKVVVTTHTSYGTPETEDFVRIVPNTPRTQISSTQKIKTQSAATPSDINYGFTYHQTEEDNQDYTEPPDNYHYHHSSIPFRHGQYRSQFKTTTYRNEHLPTTRKHPYNSNKEPTTYRTPYVSSLKTPTYHTYRTEKPQRLQLPLPLLPTLPPLTFSSPAPFTLGHHIETKRYTSDHPPRIIISASASVSDNSGRRLNYSLGTIGVTPLLEEPPKSYDEYKDHDVVLDPFYQDVPKIKRSRRKRQTKPSEINNEQAAADVLKFLFDWYQSQQKSNSVKVPIDPEDITEINQQLAPIVEAPSENRTEKDSVMNFKESALFDRKSKFNIIGDILSVTEKEKVSTVKPLSSTRGKLETVDYVDDNYEAVAVPISSTQNVASQKDIEKIVTTEQETTEATTVAETTLPPTTTTTEPTTTSRIMAIMRSRAIAHQKRIMNENKRKYTFFLSNLKPKIRRIGTERTTTKGLKSEETSTELKFETLSSTSTTTTIPVVSKRTTRKKKFTRTSRVPTSTTSKEKLTETLTTSTTSTEKLTEPPTTMTELLEFEVKTEKTTLIPEEHIDDLEAAPEQSHGESQLVHVSEQPTKSFTDEQLNTESYVDSYSEEATTKSISETDKELKSSDISTPKASQSTYAEDHISFDSTDDQLNSESQVGENLEESTTSPSEELEEKSNVENCTLEESVSSRANGNENSTALHDQVNAESLIGSQFEETVTTLSDAKEEELNSQNENDNSTNEEVVEVSEESYKEHEVEFAEENGKKEETETVDKENSDSVHDQVNAESHVGTQLEESVTTAFKETEEESNSPHKSAEGANDEVVEIAEQSYKEQEVESSEENDKKEETETTDNLELVEEIKTSDAGLEVGTTTPKQEQITQRKRVRGRGRSRFYNHNNSSGDELNKTSEEPKNEDKVTIGVLETKTINTNTNEESYQNLEDDEAVLVKPQDSDYDNLDTETSTIEAISSTTSKVLQYEDNNTEIPTEENEEATTLLVKNEKVFSETTIEPEKDYVSSTTETRTEDYEANTTPQVTEATSTQNFDLLSTTEVETATNLTPAETTTTETATPSRGRISHRRTRPPRTRSSSSYRRPNARHRFSTELVPRPSRRKPPIEEEIIDILTSQLTTTESLTKEEIPSTSPKIPTTSVVDYTEDIPATDAPLFKSANPTQAESVKESLHTTPLSMVYKLHVRKEKLKSYIFNCFGKAINKFYSDPRDCRLFHYCTNGYTKNQLLDMKFVCDLGTYFDEEKLICTKTKPERCL